LSDAFSPPAEDHVVPQPAPASPAAGGALPNVADLLGLCVKDVMNNFAGYCLAGLGPFLATMAVTMLASFVAVAAMIPGMVMEDEAVTMLGIFGATFLLVVFAMLATVPINASLYRAIWAWIDRGEPLGFSAGFSRMTEDLGTMYAYSLLVGLLTFAGMLACYVPGLLVGLFVSLAMPAIVVHRMGAIEAISFSAKHVRAHFAWHIGFWGLGLVVLMLAMNVPFIGIIVGMPLYAAYHLRGYRAIFGSGESPAI
jgi:hypothetical protein